MIREGPEGLATAGKRPHLAAGRDCTGLDHSLNPPVKGEMTAAGERGRPGRQWVGASSPKSLERTAAETAKKIEALPAKVSSALNPGTFPTSVTDTEAQGILKTVMQELCVCPHGRVSSVGAW